MSNPSVVDIKKRKTGCNVTMTWHGHNLKYDFLYDEHGDVDLSIDGKYQDEGNGRGWRWNDLPKLFPGEGDSATIWAKLADAAAAAEARA